HGGQLGDHEISLADDVKADPRIVLAQGERLAGAVGDADFQLQILVGQVLVLFEDQLRGDAADLRPGGRRGASGEQGQQEKASYHKAQSNRVAAPAASAKESRLRPD